MRFFCQINKNCKLAQAVVDLMICRLLNLIIPLFYLFRCLAHFPPADTYESRGNAADVSCVVVAQKFLSISNKGSNERLAERGYERLGVE